MRKTTDREASMRSIFSILLAVCLYASMILNSYGQGMMVQITRPLPLIHDHLVAQWSFGEGWNQYAFNKLGSNTYPVTPNLFSTGEQFANGGSDGWSASAMTLTDFFALDPNSHNTATRMFCNASSGCLLTNSATLPAGNYVFSISVKSNTGSTQHLRFIEVGTGFSSDQTVTTGWSTISYTFTVGSPVTKNVGIAIDAAGDATDVLIYGAKLESGSTPTAYVVPNLDLTLGAQPIADSADPTWSTAGLTTTSGKYAAGISNAGLTSLSTITVYAVVKKTGSDLAPGMEPIFSERYGAEIFHLASADIDGTGSGVGGPVKFPTFMFNGARTCAYSIILNDGNYHLMTGTYDGTTLRLYMDAVEVASKPATLSAQTIRRLYVSRFTARDDGTVYFPGIVLGGAIYDVAHTQNDINTNFTAFQSIVACRSVILKKFDKWIAIEGDSLSDPAGTAPYGQTIANGWGYKFFHSLSPVIPGQNFAKSGSSLQAGSLSIANAARMDAINATWDSSRSTNVLFVYIGPNDMNTTITPTDFYNQYKAYVQNMKAVHPWKVIIWTIPPNHFTGGNTKRNSINTMIYADHSWADGLTDFGGDATCGPDAAQADTSKYADGLHPTALCQDVIYTLSAASAAPFL